MTEDTRVVVKKDEQRWKYEAFQSPQDMSSRIGLQYKDVL